ncbi:MAG: hypothetical protein P1V36_18275 [Planctomycetota bacterium]|nr:hypothetical protein [Planctomycetota bacterium]
MKRIAPRAFGLAAAMLLALPLFSAPAHADDGAGKPTLGASLFSRRKVGRSGQVYNWKPDC